MAAISYSARGSKRKSRNGARRFKKTAFVRWSLLAVAGFFAINLAYQIVRKPGELLAPISVSFLKNPDSTWENYGSLFQQYSTSVITAELLAALAQVESDGNPVARPQWRWQWSWSLFEIYRPASSALGMFQITDATFIEARKYCIRDHAVVTAVVSLDPDSCWFNNLYLRILPSHSIEMTAAYLHQRVAETLSAGRKSKVTLAQKHQLAAVIHLCGPRRGEAFAARNFRTLPGELCGTHSLRDYLTKVASMQKRFSRYAATR